MLAFLDTDLRPRRALDAFVRRASEAPLPSPAEAQRLAECAAEGDEAARETLVRSLLRLVVDEAIRHRGVGQRMRDLVPAGLDALVDAATAYRPPDDGPFVDFAVARVRAAMGRPFGPH